MSKRRTDEAPIIILLAQQRARAGITQERLAQLSGQRMRQVQRWESGEQVPSLAAAYTMAAALGCKLDDLIEPVNTTAEDMTP